MLRKTNCVIFALVVCCALPSVALGLINLELRPATQTGETGDEVRIGLYAVSDSGVNQLLSSAQVILGWDPAFLRLLGIDTTGAVALLSSGFPANDPFGINEVVPPQDGNGLYQAFAYLGVSVSATPAGTLLTTFRFQALAVTPATVVAILHSAGSPVGYTEVLNGWRDVTGTLGSATVGIQNCGHGDLDTDGDTDMVDASLFVAVLLGSDTDPAHIAAADLDCSGVVDGLDIQPFVDLLLTP
jgi:hypothetical protein